MLDIRAGSRVGAYKITAPLEEAAKRSRRSQEVCHVVFQV
jgi:hypothetical protein